MPQEVLRPAIRKPRAKAKAKAKAAPRNPRQPIPRPETDPNPRLVEDVVKTYWKGEVDQPNLAKTIKRSSEKYPVQNPRLFNWVLKHSDGPDGPKFAGLQYANDDECANFVTETYDNARCDACGQTCNVLYVVRCYKKRDLDPAELQMEETEGRMHHDIRLRDNNTPRALHNNIMYFGQDCVKSLFRSRAAGAAGETTGTGNGHEDITTARSAPGPEVDKMIGWGQASDCPSARAADGAALKRNAPVACQFAIDNAVKAIQSSNEQATTAAQCRAEGERVFLEIKRLLPPDGMSLAQRRKHVQDAGPALIQMLEQRAKKVGEWFAKADRALTLAKDAQKAFDVWKSKVRIQLEICGDQELEAQASGVTSTNALVDNAQNAADVCAFLWEKVEIARKDFAVCRAMSGNVSRPGLLQPHA